jgi:hypothetical protein
MRNRFIILIFFFGLIGSSNGQILELPKKVGIQRVFGEKVSIREKPDIKSKVLSQINAGASLKIIRRTEEIHSADGISDYFYQIQNASKTGYIWGGYLADTTFEQDINLDGEKEILLLKNSTKEKELYSLKLIKNGKISGEIEKKSSPSAHFSLKVLPGDTFEPKVSLFAIFYVDEGESDTSFPKVDVFYLNKDGALQFGFQYIEKSCDPPSCFETIPIFPGEISRGKKPSGVPNRVILHIHTYDLDNETSHEYSQVEYKWTQNGFSKNE